jgi:hypothetical protein
MAVRPGGARTRAAASLLAAAAVLGLVGCAATPSVTPTAAASPEVTIEPSITPTVTPAPVPTVAPTSATGTACAAADLKASHGLVEGAAGSRLTTVVLVAQIACSIDAFPAVGLRDANGGALVGAVAAGPGRIELDPDVSYESTVRFGNWCGQEPAFPITIQLEIGAEELAVTGASFPEEGDMPPCNGGGGPVLEAGAWEASG